MNWDMKHARYYRKLAIFWSDNLVGKTHFGELCIGLSWMVTLK
jgi:hypothetical protein